MPDRRSVKRNINFDHLSLVYPILKYCSLSPRYSRPKFVFDVPKSKVDWSKSTFDDDDDVGK